MDPRRSILNKVFVEKEYYCIIGSFRLQILTFRVFLKKKALELFISAFAYSLKLRSVLTRESAWSPPRPELFLHELAEDFFAWPFHESSRAALRVSWKIPDLRRHLYWWSGAIWVNIRLIRFSVWPITVWAVKAGVEVPKLVVKNYFWKLWFFVIFKTFWPLIRFKQDSGNSVEVKYDYQGMNSRNFCQIVGIIIKIFGFLTRPLLKIRNFSIFCDQPSSRN